MSIESEIIAMVKPSEEEVAKIQKAADSLMLEVKDYILRNNIDVQVRYVGSFSKGTFLSNPDLDLFLMFPETTPKDEIVRLGLKMGEELIRIHVDPGPGALTNMCQIGYDLRQTDAIIVSHCHPDHYSDAQVVIEGMTYGGWRRRGEVYGSVSVMEGFQGLGPMMSPYHKNLAERTFVLRPGDEYDIAGLRTEIMKADHSDPTNVGFRFNTDNGVVSYVSDTYYSDEIAEQYVRISSP